MYANAENGIHTFGLDEEPMTSLTSETKPTPMWPLTLVAMFVH